MPARKPSLILTSAPGPRCPKSSPHPREGRHSQAVHDGAPVPALRLPLVHRRQQVQEGLLGVRRVPVGGPAQELEVSHQQVPLLHLGREQSARGREYQGSTAPWEPREGHSRPPSPHPGPHPGAPTPLTREMFCTRKTRATKSSSAVPDMNSTSMRPYCCRPGSGQYCRQGWECGTGRPAELSRAGGQLCSHPPPDLHACPGAHHSLQTHVQFPPTSYHSPIRSHVHPPGVFVLIHSSQLRQTLCCGFIDTTMPLDSYT